MICLACLIFLKYPLWPVWTVWAQGFLKGTILHVVKRTAICKEQLSVAASVSDCIWSRISDQANLLSKILAMMKHYKKCLWRGNFSEKLFLFILIFDQTNCRFITQTVSRHQLQAIFLDFLLFFLYKAWSKGFHFFLANVSFWSYL